MDWCLLMITLIHHGSTLSTRYLKSESVLGEAESGTLDRPRCFKVSTNKPT